MKPKPVETPVEQMRPRQKEEVGGLWQNHWRFQRQLEEVLKPRPLGPKCSHYGELRPARLPELGKYSGNDGPQEKCTPGGRPRTGERRLCLPLEGPGRERKKIEQRRFSEVANKSIWTGHRRRKD